MKIFKLLSIIFVGLFYSYSHAQQGILVEESKEQKGQTVNSQVETLFNSGTEVKGFGAIDFNFAEIRNKVSTIVGAHGGVIIDKHILIGLGGYGLASTYEVPSEDPEEVYYLFGGYSGIILGYVLHPKEVFHLSFPVLIGGGGVKIGDKDYYDPATATDPDNLELVIEDASFFIIEPAAHFEINVTKFFRLGTGVGYRFINGVSLTKFDDGDLSGPFAGFSFKFGSF